MKGELRIGNLVSYQNQFTIAVDLEIIEEIQSGASGYKPITITKKRLIILGFEKDGDYFEDSWYQKGNFAISLILKRCILIHKPYTNEEHYSELPFYNKIHELQNLYRWTVGKELTEKEKP